MDAEKIYDILIKFSSNEQRGILIDGAWGIGKTYQINRFLEKIEKDNKKKFKKTRVVYSSLFGLNSIADLHTELYAKMNPVANAVKNTIGVINPAFSLIPYAGEAFSSSVSYAIGKIDESNKKQKKHFGKKIIKKRIIIILDDLERVNSNFDYSSLLGYINQTYLLGLKIICICDATKINGPSFDELKEKVFDRYYRVTKANEDIIKMYFGSDGEYLDNATIELFNNNLRTASKASLFYFEIKKYLEKLDNKKYFLIKNNIILWYASLIVTFLNQDLIVNDYKRKINDFDFSFDFFYSYFKDDILSDKLNKCYQFDCKSKHIGKIIDNGCIDRKNLLLSLSFAYLCDDYSLLNNLLKINDEVNDSYIPLLYLSTKDRVEEIKKIIKNIDYIDVMSEKQFERILSIFEWEELKTIDFDENIIIDQIAKKCLKSDNSVIDYFSLLSVYSKEKKEVLIKIKSTYYSLVVNDLLERISKAFESNDYSQICILLNEIDQKVYCHIHDNGKIDLIPEIKDIFIENDYYLPSLTGTINEEKWHLVHEICGFIYNYSFKDVFASHLLKLKNNSKDVDEVYRISVLIKKYYPNLQQAL